MNLQSLRLALRAIYYWISTRYLAWKDIAHPLLQADVARYCRKSADWVRIRNPDGWLRSVVRKQTEIFTNPLEALVDIADSEFGVSGDSEKHIFRARVRPILKSAVSGIRRYQAVNRFLTDSTVGETGLQVSFSDGFDAAEVVGIAGKIRKVVDGMKVQAQQAQQVVSSSGGKTPGTPSAMSSRESGGRPLSVTKHVGKMRGAGSRPVEVGRVRGSDNTKVMSIVSVENADTAGKAIRIAAPGNSVDITSEAVRVSPAGEGKKRVTSLLDSGRVPQNLADESEDIGGVSRTGASDFLSNARARGGTGAKPKRDTTLVESRRMPKNRRDDDEDIFGVFRTGGEANDFRSNAKVSA